MISRSWVIPICFVALLSEGYDISVVPLAIPAIARQWGVVDRSAFGLIFSTAIFGVLVGAPWVGSLGSRIAPARLLAICLTLFGATTPLVPLVTSIPEFVVLRFVSGLGLGGVLPIGIVMVEAAAPPARRATIVALVVSAVTLGGAAAGLLAKALVAAFGWKVLFLVGGAIPLAAAFLAVTLLAANAGPSRQPAPQGNTLLDLLNGRNRPTTLLLWGMYIALGLCTSLVQNWSPTLLSSAGYAVPDIGLAIGVLQLAGVMGGAAIGWPIDRYGAWPVAGAFFAAVPALVLLAIGYRSWAILLVALFAVGFILLAIQLGLNALAGPVLPAVPAAGRRGFRPRRRPYRANRRCAGRRGPARATRCLVDGPPVALSDTLSRRHRDGCLRIVVPTPAPVRGRDDG